VGRPSWGGVRMMIDAAQCGVVRERALSGRRQGEDNDGDSRASWSVSWCREQ
jgi:hypothetical protein